MFDTSEIGFIEGQQPLSLESDINVYFPITAYTMIQEGQRNDILLDFYNHLPVIYVCLCGM